MAAPSQRIEVERLAEAIGAGDRAVLSRAITLIESKRADHRGIAAALTQALLRATGKAVRVGITGPPGVGKSTLIDALGSMLTGQGRKVAVLAVDPSSRRTGGSILADKTRMARLAADDNAFIRPSPAARTLGGVAAATCETLLAREAAPPPPMTTPSSAPPRPPARSAAWRRKRARPCSPARRPASTPFWSKRS